MGTLCQHHLGAGQPAAFVGKLGVQNDHFGRQDMSKATGIGAATGQMYFPA